MAKRVDLPKARAALASLDNLARNPELTQGAGCWADNLAELDELTTMTTSIKDRQAAFRERMRAAGYRQINVWLNGDTIAALEKLAAMRGGSKPEKLAAIISDAIQALAMQKPAAGTRQRPKERSEETAQ